MSTKIKSILECNIEKLGLKTVCYHCSNIFYDLNQDDPVCPACNTPYSKSMKVVKKAQVATEFFIDDDLGLGVDEENEEEEVFEEEVV